MTKIPYSYFTFTISFPCAPDNADTLTAAALNELRKIMNNGVSKEDIEKVKEQQTRKLEVDIKQNSFWMNNLFDAYYYGNDPSLILEKKKQIEKMDSKMIQDAAKKYIDLHKYIRATLKPDKKDEIKPKPF
jgi:zinc protease